MTDYTFSSYTTDEEGNSVYLLHSAKSYYSVIVVKIGDFFRAPRTLDVVGVGLQAVVGLKGREEPIDDGLGAPPPAAVGAAGDGLVGIAGEQQRVGELRERVADLDEAFKHPILITRTAAGARAGSPMQRL